jgi:Rrf2 family iron-sulfur cluster assembly transcriptional regulator
MLTTRSQNALHFLTALAAFPVGTVRSLQDITNAEKLPHAYLEQILPSLRKAGLVTAQRGSYGGYKLAKPASEISAWDVVQAVEQRLDQTACQGKSDCGQGTEQPGSCRLHDFLSGLNITVERYLKTSSLLTLSQPKKSVTSIPVTVHHALLTGSEHGGKKNKAWGLKNLTP